MAAIKHTATKATKSRRGGLNALLIALMVLGTIALGYLALGGASTAYAARVGYKNQQACDACEAVRDGETPSLADYSSNAAHTHAQADQRSSLTYGSDGYSTSPVTYEEVFPGAVYRGGNAKSGEQQGGNYFDEDPNDFASVLPYGNTYIDVDKLNWNEGNAFTIEIAPGAPFKWIAGRSYAGRTDSANHEVDTDPMGNGRFIQTGIAACAICGTNSTPTSSVASITGMIFATAMLNLLRVSMDATFPVLLSTKATCAFLRFCLI